MIFLWVTILYILRKQETDVLRVSRTQLGFNGQKAQHAVSRSWMKLLFNYWKFALSTLWPRTVSIQRRKTNRFCKADVQVIGLALVCHYLGLSLSFPGNCSWCFWNKDSQVSHLHPSTIKWWPGPGAIQRNSEPFGSGGRPSFSFWFCPLWLCDSQQDSLSPWILSLFCFCLLALREEFTLSPRWTLNSLSLYWPWIHNPLNPGSWVLELQEWAITPAP